jgi:HK97 family phage portal protein
VSFLSRLRAFWGGRKAATVQIVIGPGVRRWLGDISFDQLVEDGYKKNSAVLACVGALTFSFPEPPLKWFDGDDTEIANHPSRRLFKRPNPIMGESELWQYVMCYLAIGGNGYFHKIRNGRRAVIQLRPYHAGRIQPIVSGGDEMVGSYLYTSSTGQQSILPAADIVHFKWPLPDTTPDSWQAIPPLLPAAREVGTDNEARRYVYALLANDATPRTVLEVPTDSMLTPEQKEDLRAQWRAKFSGDNRGDIAIVEGGGKVNRVSLNMAELAFEALHRIPEARIAAALRVPAIVAGLNVGLERATYANYGEAVKQFTTGTLQPLWRSVASEIEADPDLNPSYASEVRFDLGSVGALQEDASTKWTRANEGLSRGGLTVNDYRRIVGLPELEGLDVFLWNNGAQVIDAQTLTPIFTPTPQLPVRKGLDREIEAYLQQHYTNGASHD